MHSKFMDSCQQVAEQASQYLDGQLTSGQRIKMRIHLMMCHQCRKFMEQFDVTVGTIKKLGDNKELSESEVNDQVHRILKASSDKDSR